MLTVLPSRKSRCCETTGNVINVAIVICLVKVIIKLALRASRVNHVTSENHVSRTSFKDVRAKIFEH